MKIYKALLMAFIILGGVLFFKYYDRKEIKQENQQAPTIKLFQPEQAQFIGLKRRESFLSAVKDRSNGSSWKLIDPDGAPADNGQLTKLLRTLSEIKTHAVIPLNEQSQDKTDYGLNPPELIATVNDGQKDYRYSFGELNFISGRRYFKVEGDDNIYLIDSFVFRSVDLVEGQFRESRPYQFKVAEVEEVIATPFSKNSIQLVKQNDNSWRVFGDNLNIDGDREMIENVLQQISTFQVAKFIDPDFAKDSLLGLDPADLKVEIRFKDRNKKPLILLFGEAKKIKGLEQNSSSSASLLNWQDTEAEFFTKNEEAPWVYKMSSPIYRDFYRSGLEFKKKEIFGEISLEKLKELQIKSTANGEVLINRDEQNKNWSSIVDSTGNKKIVAVEKLSAYVDLLTAATVISYQSQPVAAEVFGASSLEIRILLNRDELRKYVVLIGQKVDSISEENAEDAPRYAKIIEPSGREFYAIISAKLLVELDQPKSFFEVPK